MGYDNGNDYNLDGELSDVRIYSKALSSNDVAALFNTDTVGDASYNLLLSRQRAQAIAKWFRQRGLKIPIGYEGFGETALLVKTADEVDEPRNRRVDYILSVDEPVFKSSGLRPTWYRVQ